MSEYIEKIEKDYNDGKISKEEATKLKLDYQKNWGGDDIEELENELKGINPKKKNTKPKTKYEEKVINLLEQQNSKLSTIKSILQVFFFFFILSLLSYFIILGSI
ncbi:hypothetical protein OAB60_00840 [Flavobacteriaceae bacterium]|nr:hypothetical protein [Flavobacteriaceae bacterium]